MNRTKAIKTKQLDEPRPLLEHLGELRKRIIYSLIAILLGAAGVYPLVNTVLGHLIQPVGQLVFISPVEAFGSRLKLTFFLGIFVSLPVVLYQIWKFIQKGLLPREKRNVFPLVFLSFILFSLGGCFGYFVIIPIGVKFLLSYGTETLVPMISVSRYLSFLFSLVFCFGLIFELPLIIGFLTKLGILRAEVLRTKRRFAVLGIFVTAAILTPPDVFTQLLMAGPLLALYEISIHVARLIEAKAKP
ncbi:MAG: twin-arginine translocase subunit TatC, partial [Candidatus Omnitrophota bacterium]